MINLYDISNNYLILMNGLPEHEEECDQNYINLLKAIDEIEDQIENKAVNIAAYIKNLEAEYEQVNKARSSMQEREKGLKRRIDWLEDYLKSNLQKCGISEIKSSPNFVIKVKNCPYSVNIIDESKVPNDYKLTKEVISIDKKKLKDDLQQGLFVEGAELQRNLSLQIK